MSATPCAYCSRLRKVDQIATPDGWQNPPCAHCSAPGWMQPYGTEDDPAQGGPPRTAPGPARPMCTRWQELTSDPRRPLAFSCDCAGTACPDDPRRSPMRHQPAQETRKPCPRCPFTTGCTSGAHCPHQPAQEAPQ